jgi:hypothetical protein
MIRFDRVRRARTRAFRRGATRAAVAAALLAVSALPSSAQRGPAPTPTGLAEDVLALACAPRTAYDYPDQSLRVTGGQESFRKRSFAPGDLVTINAGAANGIEPGQQYYVRRLQMVANRRPTADAPASVRTTGWIKVYAVDDEMSLATIVHACDSIDVEDYLEPFALPAVPAASAEKIKPQRDHYGTILFGSDNRRVFGKGDFFIINRGREHGVAAGDRFVIYRDKKQSENFLFDLGEAVAVSVNADTSTLQAVSARDAVMEGDYVAIRKAPADTPGWQPAPKKD